MKKITDRELEYSSEKLMLYIEMCNALRSIDKIIKAELDLGNLGNHDMLEMKEVYRKLNLARVAMYHELSHDDVGAYQRKINNGELGMESWTWK